MEEKLSPRGEFKTPHTKILASPVVVTIETLPCSPLLVLSFPKASNHSKAYFVVKPIDGAPTEELDVTSQSGPVSLMMSERMFGGDLPEEKGLNLTFSQQERNGWFKS